MSTVAYALLSLLVHRPSTGYQLAQRMRRPIGYLWTAQHSRIYPQLARLEEAGWVRSRTVAGPGPRDTKRYTVTPQGRRALQAWFDSPLSPPPRRSELLLRVRCLWLVEPQRARSFLLDRRAEAQALMGTYEEERTRFDEAAIADPTSPEFAAYATLQYGLTTQRAVLDWFDWLLGTLSPTAESPP